MLLGNRVFGAACVVFAACAASPTRSPLESDYAVDLAAGFVAHGDTLRYSVAIRLKDTVRLPARVRVEFDDPARPGGPPLVQELTHELGERLQVVSGPVEGVSKDAVYRVRFVFLPAEGDEPIGIHTTRVAQRPTFGREVSGTP